nr:MAG TPA: hypothetical protein [Caudoviricetes sp.]
MICCKSLSVFLFKAHLLPAPTLGAGLVSISALLADYLLLLFAQSYGSLQALHICGCNHKAVRFKFGHINRRALYAFFSEYFLLYFHYSRPFPSLPCYNRYYRTEVILCLLKCLKNVQLPEVWLPVLKLIVQAALFILTRKSSAG